MDWKRNDRLGRDGQRLDSGGRYNPSTDTWIATSTTNAPDARNAHTAVWTGSQMIVWGGVATSSIFSTGGRYNPGTNSWTATSTTNAPAARFSHTAVWTGSEMIAWGGTDGGLNYLDTGGRYCAQAGAPTPTATLLQAQLQQLDTQSHRYTYFNTKSYTYTTATPYTGASAVSAAFVPRLRTTTSN